MRVVQNPLCVAYNLGKMGVIKVVDVVDFIGVLCHGSGFIPNMHSTACRNRGVGDHIFTVDDGRSAFDFSADSGQMALRFDFGDEFEQSRPDLVFGQSRVFVADRTEADLPPDVFKSPGLVEDFVQFRAVGEELAQLFERFGEFVAGDLFADLRKEELSVHTLYFQWSDRANVKILPYFQGGLRTQYFGSDKPGGKRFRHSGFGVQLLFEGKRFRMLVSRNQVLGQDI